MGCCIFYDKKKAVFPPVMLLLTSNILESIYSQGIGVMSISYVTEVEYIFNYSAYCHTQVADKELLVKGL